MLDRNARGNVENQDSTIKNVEFEKGGSKEYKASGHRRQFSKVRVSLETSADLCEKMAEYPTALWQLSRGNSLISIKKMGPWSAAVAFPGSAHAHAT